MEQEVIPRFAKWMDTKYEKEGQGHVEPNLEDEGKAKGDKKLYSLLSTLTQMMHRNGNENIHTPAIAFLV